MIPFLLLTSALLLPGRSAASADDVASVLAQLEQDIEHHRWLRVLDGSDPAHLEAQTLRMRKTHADYIAELLCIETAKLAEASRSGSNPPRILRVRDLRPRNLFSGTPGEGLLKPNLRRSAGSATANPGLDQIRNVRWQGEPIVASSSRRIIPGTATLRSGEQISLTVTLVKRPSGWLLTGRGST